MTTVEVDFYSKERITLSHSGETVYIKIAGLGETQLPYAAFIHGVRRLEAKVYNANNPNRVPRNENPPPPPPVKFRGIDTIDPPY